jgi:hypothetical protein
MAEHIDRTNKTYGLIPLDQWLENVKSIEKIDPGEYRTFREDYGLSGADEGTICVSYHGQCSNCGLEVTFNESKDFWP